MLPRLRGCFAPWVRHRLLTHSVTNAPVPSNTSQHGRQAQARHDPGNWTARHHLSQPGMGHSSLRIRRLGVRVPPGAQRAMTCGNIAGRFYGALAQRSDSIPPPPDPLTTCDTGLAARRLDRRHHRPGHGAVLLAHVATSQDQFNERTRCLTRCTRVGGGTCRTLPNLRLLREHAEGVELAERLPGDPAPLPDVAIPALSGSWRRGVAAVIEDMYHLTRWLQAKSQDPNSQILVEAVDAHLNAVRKYLSRRRPGGLTAILGHLQAAQANLLRLAPLWYVRSWMPNIVMHARRTLDKTDLQLVKLEELGRKSESADLSEGDRQLVVTCLAGANEQVRTTQLRLESFRNVIAASALFLFFFGCYSGVYKLCQARTAPCLLPVPASR